MIFLKHHHSMSGEGESSLRRAGIAYGMRWRNGWEYTPNTLMRYCQICIASPKIGLYQRMKCSCEDVDNKVDNNGGNNSEKEEMEVLRGGP